MQSLPADVSATPGLMEESAARCGTPSSALEEEVTALFDQFRNPLFRFLLSLGLTAQDGEEIIQEVFLALFQHLKNGKPRDNLRGWIFRVGHNQGLKLLGRRNSRPAFTSAPISEEPMDPDPNPEERAVTSQRQRRLTAVVNALAAPDRACLSLRAEGLRYREIAEILGISLGAVSLSLERSLARLSRAQER